MITDLGHIFDLAASHRGHPYYQKEAESKGQFPRSQNMPFGAALDE